MMREGWTTENYLMLFDESEVAALTERYGIADYLPGFQVMGLWGWDEFIVTDQTGNYQTVPTIPVDVGGLAPFNTENLHSPVEQDKIHAGQIKWYVKPIAFGGDPSSVENIIWINIEQHTQLVRWWNLEYKKVKAEHKRA